MASSGGLHAGAQSGDGGRRRRHIDRFVPFDLRQVGGEKKERERGKRARQDGRR